MTKKMPPRCKTCNRCGRVRFYEEFNKRSKSPDGLRHTCRECDQGIREGWEAKQSIPPEQREVHVTLRNRSGGFIKGPGLTFVGVKPKGASQRKPGTSGAASEPSTNPPVQSKKASLVSSGPSGAVSVSPEAPPTRPENVLGFPSTSTTASGAALGGSNKLQVGPKPLPGVPRIREVAMSPMEAAEKAAAIEYAALLNKGLPVRRRARLMIEIAKNVKGGAAALALRALQDINEATNLVNKQGAQVDLGPLFVLPDADDVKMA